MQRCKGSDVKEVVYRRKAAIGDYCVIHAKPKKLIFNLRCPKEEAHQPVRRLNCSAGDRQNASIALSDCMSPYADSTKARFLKDKGWYKPIFKPFSPNKVFLDSCGTGSAKPGPLN